MRVAKFDEAREGRGNTLSRAFREVLSARMFWAAGGIALVGLMAAFVFYNPSVQAPLQNQATPEQETATVQANTPEVTPPAAEVAALATTEEEVLATTTCDTVQQHAAEKKAADLKTEDDRYRTDQKQNIRQLFSVLTGGKSEELQQHEARITAIHDTYQQTLASVHCE